MVLISDLLSRLGFPLMRNKLVVWCSIQLAWLTKRAFGRFLFCFAVFIGFTALAGFASHSKGSEIDDVKNFYRTGDYAACIKLASEQVERGVWNELWPRILIESSRPDGASSI